MRCTRIRTVCGAILLKSYFHGGKEISYSAFEGNLVYPQPELLPFVFWVLCAPKILYICFSVWNSLDFIQLNCLFSIVLIFGAQRSWKWKSLVLSPNNAQSTSAQRKRVYKQNSASKINAIMYEIFCSAQKICYIK